MDFAVLTRPPSKIKESEKITCLKTKKKKKKLWDIKMTVILIVVVALGKIIKGSVKRLEDLELKRWHSRQQQYQDQTE